MLYKEVGLLSALGFFVGIILCYKVTTFLVFKFKSIEQFLEGKPIYLIEDGVFLTKNFDKEALGYDEFFAEMRQKNVSHLEQIDIAILEISGELSLYYYKDEDVLYGLPVLPLYYDKQFSAIPENRYYSCTYCGFTEVIAIKQNHLCPNCTHHKWAHSINTTRLT